MTNNQPLRCLICGGDHAAHPFSCDQAGMDAQIKRLGVRRWNRLTAAAMRALNRDGAVGEAKEGCDK
jgi:hypothetical protein